MFKPIYGQCTVVLLHCTMPSLVHANARSLCTSHNPAPPRPAVRQQRYAQLNTQQRYMTTMSLKRKTMVCAHRTGPFAPPARRRHWSPPRAALSQTADRWSAPAQPTASPPPSVAEGRRGGLTPARRQGLWSLAAESLVAGSRVSGR